MAPPNPADFEKLGVFYLGRVHDLDAHRTGDDLVLYDAKDLTTHAVCVGMTGSGKTGLCLSLLEEAAIDGIPAIAIDPKGDLGNLLLTFPKLAPEDFRPWVDESEATREGRTLDAQAAATAQLWRDGLAKWGQDGERIARLKAAADFVIWTPGSSAGLPVSILRSFAVPPAAVLEDADALRERVLGTASGLLALAGIDADPVRSREHVLLSNILDTSWRAGQSLDLGGLIRAIQQPPFARVGVVDLDSFYPANDRFALAMALNNLAASPAFASWMEGDPLDVARMLRAPDGRPRVSIVSIAHLSDAERMFFVTMLLQETIAWMRQQPGTGSLRAILFMDEVFGFLPPVANPPSKTPMITLLKQARAYGLGVVIATQNPVDVDYKALSNAGTWFLGRLQTERDKMRVLDGLEGASATAGREFDRARTEAILSGLSKRIFLMSNAHEDAPVLFESRWALSYLRGPLTRPQVQQLMAQRKQDSPPAQVAPVAAATSAPAPAAVASSRPLLPPGVPEVFLPRKAGTSASGTLYRPRLLARARLHHVAAKDGVDAWRDLALLAALPENGGETAWGEADALDGAPATSGAPEAGARFEPLPGSVSEKTLAACGKSLAAWAVSSAPMTLLRCEALEEVSKPGESEADFRGRLAHASRERRDLAVEKLRQQYAPKVARLQERQRKAQQAREVQAEQASHAKLNVAVSIGATVLGALFGRKALSASTLGRATTAARTVGRASNEGQDVERADANIAAAAAELADLERQLADETRRIEEQLDPTALTVTSVQVPARKGDAACSVTLCWTPWALGPDGLASPAW